MKSSNALIGMIIAGFMGMAAAGFGAAGIQYIGTIKKLIMISGIAGACVFICLGVVMLIMYTRTSDEETRKSYLRLILLLINGLIIIGLSICFIKYLS